MSGHRKEFSFMKNPKWWLAFILLSAGTTFSLRASENLRLNPRLDYSSDSLDGALITGDHMEEAAVAGKPNYIIFYGEGCFNSKRQARRTVDLYPRTAHDLCISDIGPRTAHDLCISDIAPGPPHGGPISEIQRSCAVRGHRS